MTKSSDNARISKPASAEEALPVSEERGVDLGEGRDPSRTQEDASLPFQALITDDCDGDSGDEAERRDQEKARDLALVERIQAGDDGAFAEILDLYQGRVFRIVRRIWQRERETAEDLCQEVFMRVFRGIPSFQGTSAFSTWVHRITVNVCITEIRSRKALKRDRPTLSLDAPLSGGDADDPLRIEPEATVIEPGQALETRELFEACRNAIETLPSMWRMILQLRDLEEKSYEEISEILELPIGTVRSRLHRARARVRALLDGGGR